ncbi:hypothetical protein CRG98_002339 [Punica granatum]|uniref:G-patch domain-containing protein n=1 Tax=Punica granatum TaxID=22663 RepID=A0A2I0L9D0_PUNGR|nr:hypothetical protein CRG98_002339 [Punica granatum]
MRAELQSIREERDRLHCELIDTCAEVADYRELQRELARACARATDLDREIARLSATLDRARAKARKVITTGVISLPHSPTHQDGRREPNQCFRGSHSTNLGSFSTTLDACYAASNSHRHTTGVFRRSLGTSPTAGTFRHAPDVLRGTPSTSLATNSAGIIYLRRPCAPCSTRRHAVPLPPAAFLTSDQTMSALPPVSMLVSTPIYTVPTSMVFPELTTFASAHIIESFPSPTSQPIISLPYQALPPLNIPFLESGTLTHTAPTTPPTNFLLEAKTEQEHRLKRMEETIRAPQANETLPNASYGDCSLFPGMRLPSKVKIPKFKTYEGTTDPWHHLHHYREKMLQYWDYEEFVIHSFQDSLTGSALDWFMSLKAEDVPTWADLSQKFIDQYQYCAEAPPTLLELSTKEMAQGQKFEDYATKWRAQAAKHIPPISEPYSVNFTPAPSSTPGYTPPTGHYQLPHPAQPIYYLALPASLPPTTSQPFVHHYTPAPPPPPQFRPPASRALEPTQQVPAPQGQPGDAAQYRPRRQFAPLSVPLSHIYRQLLASNQIRLVAPGPNFDPSTQDQFKHCEYHQGAPGHTLNNCWRLRDEIQKRIDNNQLTFNAVKPPNYMRLERGRGRTRPPPPFVVNYVPEEPTVGFTGNDTSLTPFVKDIPAPEPYSNNKVPWIYEGNVGSLEQQFNVMSVTRSGRIYENLMGSNKGKVPATEVEVAFEAAPIPPKRVTEEEAEAFMRIVKASEYKIVEQMAKSSVHISLLALLLSSESYREALLRVLTAAQVPKETPPDKIGETVSSIFSNSISFSDDELPFEGWAHSRALHIVCKCNNYAIGQVMIDNGSALNVCLVTTLKQMNVDLNRIRPSQTAVRAFDGSWREVNREIDLLIDVGLCSFSVTLQVLDIPNAFSLLLGRPWIHSAGAVPSSLHQKLKFIIGEKLITVKGEEGYTIYKETAVPYIGIGDNENLPFHSFKIISVIWDYREVCPTRADCMVRKILMRHNYIQGAGLGAHGQGISHPIEVEEYKHRRGLGFRPSCHEIVEARRNKHLRHLAAHYGRLNRGLIVPPLSHFFPGSPHSDDAPVALPALYAITKEIPSGVHIRLVQENEELDNWTSVPRYSAVIADV